VKKLYKSRKNRVLCGVCGGIGEYFNIDPVIVRLICLVFFCTGGGIVAYIIAAIIIPDEY
jgi:phage shock protein PspC (stress-responsive transcriptional regulator)